MNDRSDPEITPETLDLISQLYCLPRIVEARVPKVQSGMRRMRMVAQIQPRDVQPMIVRLSADPNVTDARMCAANEIMETLRTYGIPVPRIARSSGGSVCMTISFSGQQCFLTIETLLPGHPVQAIERGDVVCIASTLAHMHQAAESSSLRVGISSPFQATADVDDVLVSNAEWFFAAISTLGTSLSAERELRRAFKRACARVAEHICSTQQFAAQCDTIPPNILIDEDRSITGIVDFHLAGDIVLVNDLVNGMAYIDHMMWSDSNSEVSYRREMLRLYVQSYVECRLLNDTERKLFGSLTAITVPFVRMRLDSIVDAARAGQIEWANSEIASMRVEMEDTLCLVVD